MGDHRVIQSGLLSIAMQGSVQVKSTSPSLSLCTFGKLSGSTITFARSSTAPSLADISLLNYSVTVTDGDIELVPSKRKSESAIARFKRRSISTIGLSDLATSSPARPSTADAAIPSIRLLVPNPERQSWLDAIEAALPKRKTTPKLSIIGSAFRPKSPLPSPMMPETPELIIRPRQPSFLDTPPAPTGSQRPRTADTLRARSQAALRFSSHERIVRRSDSHGSLFARKDSVGSVSSAPTSLDESVEAGGITSSPSASVHQIRPLTHAAMPKPSPLSSASNSPATFSFWSDTPSPRRYEGLPARSPRLQTPRTPPTPLTPATPSSMHERSRLRMLCQLEEFGPPPLLHIDNDGPSRSSAIPHDLPLSL